MEKSLVHLMRGVRFQMFLTLTLADRRVGDRFVTPSEGLCIRTFFACEREIARKARVHSRRLVWALRQEEGEQTNRRHFHVLIGGIPDGVNVVSLAHTFAWLWSADRNEGGFAMGFAKAREFISGGDGSLSYLLKNLDTRLGANIYELSKFGFASEVTLSRSLIKLLSSRARYSAQQVKKLNGGVIAG